MRFPRQEYQCEFPFPPPGDLPDPEIGPMSPVSPTLQVDSLPLSHLREKKKIKTMLSLIHSIVFDGSSMICQALLGTGDTQRISQFNES